MPTNVKPRAAFLPSRCELGVDRARYPAGAANSPVGLEGSKTIPNSIEQVIVANIFRKLIRFSRDW